ncbi:MAG: M67 family metallopeptidase [Anaerolineales bacterium]|nr:M67 family metallopeptidase [Anaerolineales bacterium]
MRTLSLTQEQIQQMIAHVDAHLPYEACGLLAGRGSSVENVLMVTNQAQSPVRYLMDPIEQLHAFEWIEAQGLDLLGIFHSHPTGPETVSPTDIAEAAYDVVYVIVSRSNGIWHTHRVLDSRCRI